MNTKILMIDDEQFFLQSHIYKLEQKGYTVEAAKEVDKAIQHICETVFDLIILDILMPPSLEESSEAIEETGLRLQSFIRNQKTSKNQKTPIIFLTAINDAEIRNKARKLEEMCGLQFTLLSKPALPSELVEEVEEILNREGN